MAWGDSRHGGAAWLHWVVPRFLGAQTSEETSRIQDREIPFVAALIMSKAKENTDCERERERERHWRAGKGGNPLASSPAERKTKKSSRSS